MFFRHMFHLQDDIWHSGKTISNLNCFQHGWRTSRETFWTSDFSHYTSNPGLFALVCSHVVWAWLHYTPQHTDDVWISMPLVYFRIQTASNSDFVTDLLTILFLLLEAEGLAAKIFMSDASCHQERSRRWCAWKCELAYLWLYISFSFVYILSACQMSPNSDWKMTWPPWTHKSAALDLPAFYDLMITATCANTVPRQQRVGKLWWRIKCMIKASVDVQQHNTGCYLSQHLLISQNTELCMKSGRMVCIHLDTI